MIILIMLIVIIGIGICIAKYSYDFEFLGFILTFIFGMWLIIHILFWSLASYDYNLFVAKREAFVETLKTAREEKGSLELAAITKDVSKWNEELAVSKYNLTVFLIKDYTDERIAQLEAIR